MQDEDVKQDDNFLAEAAVMDLSPLRDKTFAVAVGTGDPNKGKFLCSTLHGPYTFIEMVQEVGAMWVEQQHHAKPIVMNKDIKARVEVLDANTVDYIECHYADIITEEMLGGAFDDKDFTHVAGTVFEAPAEIAKDAP